MSNKGFWFAAIVVLLLSACNTSTPPDYPTTSTGGGTAPTPTPTPTPTTTVSVGTSATTLLADGVATAIITATVLTAGLPVPDGTPVNFTLSSALGTLTPANPVLTTGGGGNAQVTFTAGTTPGAVTVTATSLGASGITVPITLGSGPPPAGGIQFVSATPTVIGIAGGGQPTTSTIVFRVTDSAGAPAAGSTVNFTMKGPSGGRAPAAGGEYIGASDASPTTASGTTDATGNVSVILNSGAVAGPVTITATATVGAASFTASSSVISIGGGLPSARHFDLVTQRFNLPGLLYSNIQTNLSAFIADRFGNYNVLQGTTVSFYAFEAGAVDTSNNSLDNTGATSVVFRTQAPSPIGVAITAAEVSAITALNTRYGTAAGGTLTPAIPTDGSVNPRNGWVTVLASVMGEETFNDRNGNGLYDSAPLAGEPYTGAELFTDLSEPFTDKNNDGCRNDGVNQNCNGTVSPSTEPFEDYTDANGDAVYNPPNAVWDGPGCTGSGCLTSKTIWKDITLAFTGHATYCAAAATTLAGAPTTFDLANAETKRIRFMVGDQNLNRLVPGTVIDISGTGITVNAPPSAALTIPDGIGGPTQISFTIADLDPDPASVPEPYTVTITVTPPQSEGVFGCFVQISGTSS